MLDRLDIGTYSWKYDSWRGLIYPKTGEINYLEHYSRHYKTVEIDQWFWSLHGPDKISLPLPHVVESYRESVPDDFRFTIKVPNAITLTHFYQKSKGLPLEENPHFLSIELFEQFLQKIEPLLSQTQSLMFQFEYVNNHYEGSAPLTIQKLISFLDPSQKGPTRQETLDLF